MWVQPPWSDSKGLQEMTQRELGCLRSDISTELHLYIFVLQLRKR